MSGLGTRTAKEITDEGKKPREAIRGIDVAFKNIKREVVKAAERPHSKKQQGRGAKGWMLEEQETCGKQSQEQKEDSFYFDPRGIAQVSHNWGRSEAL